MSTDTEAKRPVLHKHPLEGIQFVTVTRGWVPAGEGSSYDEVPVRTRTYDDGTIDIYVGGWKVNRDRYKTVRGAEARVAKALAR